MRALPGCARSDNQAEKDGEPAAPRLELIDNPPQDNGSNSTNGCALATLAERWR
jgi:hypothetical protein